MDRRRDDPPLGRQSGRHRWLDQRSGVYRKWYEHGVNCNEKNLIHFGRRSSGVAYEGVDILSTGEIVPDHVATRKLGDFNLSGTVTSADITAMIAALADINTYKTSHVLSTDDLLNSGDLDGDGKITNADLQGLITFITSGQGSVAPVPEPTGIVLLAIGGLCLTEASAKKERWCKLI